MNINADEEREKEPKEQEQRVNDHGERVSSKCRLDFGRCEWNMKRGKNHLKAYAKPLPQCGIIMVGLHTKAGRVCVRSCF